MWAQLQQSLKKSPIKVFPDGMPKLVSVDTVRHMRSAASQWSAYSLLLEHPGCVLEDSNHKLAVQPCRFTDSLESTLFYRGMSTRLGSDTRPSRPLLRRHLVKLEASLNQRYCSASTPAATREFAKAGLALLLLYLGWLRSGEAFSTKWFDWAVTEPRDYATLDLPRNVGCVSLRLLQETKSDRTKAADVIMAYTTVSGLSIGKWWHRLLRSLHLTKSIAADLPNLVFVHDNGSPWTSSYYRTTYIYPLLETLKGEGDPYLQMYDDTPGNSIADHFWSLHTLRRFANTEVDKPHAAPRRQATEAEKYEHGRWKHNRSSESMPVQYREWSVRERINITLYCQ